MKDFLLVGLPVLILFSPLFIFILLRDKEHKEKTLEESKTFPLFMRKRNVSLKKALEENDALKAAALVYLMKEEEKTLSLLWWDCDRLKIEVDKKYVPILDILEEHKISQNNP